MSLSQGSAMVAVEPSNHADVQKKKKKKKIDAVQLIEHG
jgi:hypothetical protein